VVEEEARMSVKVYKSHGFCGFCNGNGQGGEGGPVNESKKVDLYSIDVIVGEGGLVPGGTRDRIVPSCRYCINEAIRFAMRNGFRAVDEKTSKPLLIDGVPL
jgi:hypothetical protein